MFVWEVVVSYYEDGIKSSIGLEVKVYCHKGLAGHSKFRESIRWALYDNHCSKSVLHILTVFF